MSDQQLCRNCRNFYGDHRTPKILRDSIGFCKVSPLECATDYGATSLHYIWPAVDENDSCPRFEWAADPEMWVDRKVPDNVLKSVDERRLLG